MRRTIATLALMALAIPAIATDCAELEITDRAKTAGTPAEGIYTAVVGQFLWVYYGDAAPDFGQENAVSVSVDIGDPDVIGATVCPNGIVTIHRAETEAPEAEAPLPEVVNLGEVFADFQPLIDALVRFRPFGG